VVHSTFWKTIPQLKTKLEPFSVERINTYLRITKSHSVLSELDNALYLNVLSEDHIVELHCFLCIFSQLIEEVLKFHKNFCCCVIRNGKYIGWPSTWNLTSTNQRKNKFSFIYLFVSKCSKDLLFMLFNCWPQKCLLSTSM
jgi:hypothetical protein